MNAPPATTSKAAIAAIVLAGIGFCFFPFGLIGLVLGIIGIVNTSPLRMPRLGGRTLAIIAIALVPFQVVTTGIVAAIAIPNFVQFQSRAKASEAKANVRAIYTGARTYEAEKDEYPDSVPLTPAVVPCGTAVAVGPSDFAAWEALRFAPTGPLRYSYSFTRKPGGKGFIVAAKGDLDCDGITSSFTMEEDGALHSDQESE